MSQAHAGLRGIHEDEAQPQRVADVLDDGELECRSNRIFDENGSRPSARPGLRMERAQAAANLGGWRLP